MEFFAIKVINIVRIIFINIVFETISKIPNFKFFELEFTFSFKWFNEHHHIWLGYSNVKIITSVNVFRRQIFENLRKLGCLVPQSITKSPKIFYKLFKDSNAFKFWCQYDVKLLRKEKWWKLPSLLRKDVLSDIKLLFY